MFADWVKIALKVVLLATIAGLVVAIFTVVQIPDPGFSDFSGAIATGKAVAAHWLPGFDILWSVALVLLALSLAIPAAKLAILVVKWVVKANE